MPIKGFRWTRNLSAEKDQDEAAAANSSFDSARPSHQGDSRSLSTESSAPVQRARSVDGHPYVSRPIASAYAHSDVSRTPPATPSARPSTSRLRMKFRQHSSETHLASMSSSLHADDVPPVPPMPNPTIITTAPPTDGEPMLTVPTAPPLTRKRSKIFQFTRSKVQDATANQSESANQTSDSPMKNEKKDEKKDEKKRFKISSMRASRDPAAELRRLAGDRLEFKKSLEEHSSPSIELQNPDDKTEANSPASEDGRGFTWLKKKQNRKSLFPILVDRPGKAHTAPPTVSPSPRPSTSGAVTEASSLKQLSKLDISSTAPPLDGNNGMSASSTALSSQGGSAPRRSMARSSSVASRHSISSSPALPLPSIDGRNRSSTADSTSGFSDSPPTPPFITESSRNSTSTAGRSSFSNLFHISRFRNNDPTMSPRQGSGTNVTAPTTMTASGTLSGSNSMSLSRDSIGLPAREEGETAKRYLERLEEIAHRSQIPSALSKRSDEFFKTVMRSFMRKFAFFGDPLDMAIRKILLEVDLPKETQQIDRVLQGFAERYEECNPGIYESAENAYLMAFSLLLLHSDFFNKNNKRKMTKPDYMKNLHGQGVADEILDCFYDNITYTPFIRVEDELDMLTMRSRKTNRKTVKAAKAAKAAMKNVPTGDNTTTKRANIKEPLDPYTLIFESRLDTLRPSVKDLLNLDDPYTYLGSLPVFDTRILKNSKVGVIQIESARSRPDAFMSQSGIDNPLDNARVGLVDLPVGKIGVLWRKDPKKKTARSPWQEWGAILTGVNLYFFRNAGWVKNYLHQYETHIKHGGQGNLCFFKPPVQDFKPDYMLPTDHGVALTDSTYKRHKNAFTFFRHNGSEEIFLADNEMELNDWLAKLNHQAACRTAGIPQRGLVGGQYDGQLRRGIRRLESNDDVQGSPSPKPDSSSASPTRAGQQSVRTIQTATGEVIIRSGAIDLQLAQQISAKRARAVETKIAEAEEKLAIAQEQLEEELRNARHVLILAPIQQRTREVVVHSAEVMQERMKKLRVDIWRLTCHKDILEMDLDEEKREFIKRQARIDGNQPTVASLTSSEMSKAAGDHSDAVRDTAAAETVAEESEALEQEELENGFETPPEEAIEDAEEDEDEAQTPTLDPRSRRRSSGRAMDNVGLGINDSPSTAKTKSPPSASRGRANSLGQSRGHGHGNSVSTVSNKSLSSQAQPTAPRSSWDASMELADSSLVGANLEEGRGRSKSRSRSRSRASSRTGGNEENGEEQNAVKDRPVTPSSLQVPAASTPVKNGQPGSAEKKTPERGTSIASSTGTGSKLRKGFPRPFRDSSLKNIHRHPTSEGQQEGSNSDADKTPTAQASEFPGTLPHPPSPRMLQSPSKTTADGRPVSPTVGMAHLQRDGTSFTVHGKKASIVTFGGDWVDNAEERLQSLQAQASRRTMNTSPLSTGANGVRARSVSGGSTSLAGPRRIVKDGSKASDAGSIRTANSTGTTNAISSVGSAVRDDETIHEVDASGTPTPTPTVTPTPTPASPEAA